MNEAVDFFDEVGGGIERATTNSALSDEGEEAFDLVEPGGVGGGEVNVQRGRRASQALTLGCLWVA